MKKRILLLVTLLLICALIPLQEATAEVELEIVGDSSQVTTIIDTNDIIFTIRVTGQEGDDRTLYMEIWGETEQISDQLLNKTDPALLTVSGAGTHDVTITIPRAVILNEGSHEFTFFALDLLDLFFIYQISFVVNVTLPDATVVDISLKVEGSLNQNFNAGEIRDATFTLSVTNKSEVPDLQIDVAFIEDAYGVNVDLAVDSASVTLDPASFELASGATQQVALTISADAFSKAGNYLVGVTATPEIGFAKSVSIRINVFPTSSLVLEVLDDLEKTTTTTETDDIYYNLRLTNTGSDIDRVIFDVFGDIDTASIDQIVVELFPDSFEDFTVTIPRTALQYPGTYVVFIFAKSQNDINIIASIITKTIVTGNPLLPTKEMIEDTEDTEDTEDLRQPDLSTHKVVFSEFMFESVGGEDGLPQWIEVYNSSTKEINLRGWKLHWKHLQPIPFEVTITFKEDFIIPVEQSRLIVTSLGRHSGGAKLSDDAVYQLHHLHAEELTREDIEIRNRLIDRGGFSLKLINPNDVIIDHIGTLTGNKQTWQLHECLVNGVRTSLIRRFDKGVPRSGTERRGWRRAIDAKRLVAGIYYGHSHDLGTPAYRRGKPLPVELSQFSARFVKDKVVINWTTESELNNAGFNILRSTSRTKNFRPINTKLIKGAGTTGERNTYQFIDKTAKPNVAYYYRIEDIDLSGIREVLTTYQLRGVIAPTGKFITTWSTLKGDR